MPRILALFDSDRTSISYGSGDRYHWAWGLIDFSNGTFQGAAHGLARIWTSGLWPYETSRTQFHERISSIFASTKRITRSDGSLEEAFPHEGSYCVTALVAFDLLSAIDLLSEEVSDQQTKYWCSIVEPLIGYLIKADETHAIISNHLATAVAALFRWHRITGASNAEQKAIEQLQKILSHQSEEGWFREYEGADPGYQTLCLYYLADVHLTRPDLSLLEPLRRSIQFLWHFAHPDGSFGGLYGSRCTRFYYPAGILSLSDQIPEAAALAQFMANSIDNQQVVTLSSMDEPNLMPMFNAYAWAASVENTLTQPLAKPSVLPPCQEQKSTRRYFPKAGLVIDRGINHYTIISTHKGGVVYHFRSGKLQLLNAGVVFQNSRGTLGSTQAFNKNNPAVNEVDRVEVTSQVVAMPKQLPSPFQFLVLRLLSLTIFRSYALREWVKRKLVTMLITRQKAWAFKVKRRILLGEALDIQDEFDLPLGYRVLEGTGPFIPIHMASQGYWQIQDDEAKG